MNVKIVFEVPQDLNIKEVKYLYKLDRLHVSHILKIPLLFKMSKLQTSFVHKYKCCLQINIFLIKLFDWHVVNQNIYNWKIPKNK